MPLGSGDGDEGWIVDKKETGKRERKEVSVDPLTGRTIETWHLGSFGSAGTNREHRKTYDYNLNLSQFSKVFTS